MSQHGEFEFHWADKSDEKDIRKLAGAVVMPGAVAVRFAREPDYFLGTTIMGDPCQVLIARHKPDGQLAGIACLAMRRTFVNGQETQIGYIGQIRVTQDFRGKWLVPLGARYFKEASPDGLTCLGVIARENPRARRVLVEDRMPAGMQAVRLSGLTTYAILLRKQPKPHFEGIRVQPGSQGGLGEIVDFLHRHGPRRQFFPAYTPSDFSGGRTMRGLQTEHIMVAYENGRIAGIMAAWDQAAYKQDIVDSYGTILSLGRPIYDMTARLLGASVLTRPDQTISLAFAACICVKEDRPPVMRALLSHCMESALDRGKAFLMIGMADEDPLLGIARRQLHITYHSDLFMVGWSSRSMIQLDGRAPYIEIATL